MVCIVRSLPFFVFILASEHNGILDWVRGSTRQQAKREREEETMSSRAGYTKSPGDIAPYGRCTIAYCMIHDRVEEKTGDKVTAAETGYWNWDEPERGFFLSGGGERFG